MKKMLSLILAVLMLASVLAGCGSEEKPQETTAAQTAPGTTEAPQIVWGTEGELTNKYILGYWGDKFVRSNGHTYPYMLYNPLNDCKGLTLEYTIMNVSDGNLKGNYRYEVYIHEVDGDWKSVKVVEMEETSMKLELTFDKAVDIDGVAVVCGKKGSVEFEFDIKVSNPV